jgi:Na+/proline symporter
MTRWMTLFFGILQIVLAIIFVSISLDRLIVDQVLAVAGFSSGILVGVFTLGVTTRRVGQISAMCGMVAGTAVLCYVKFLTTVAWPWYTLIGAVITIVCGLLLSLMLDKPATDAHTEAT